MSFHTSVLSLLLPVCAAAAFAQDPVPPSVTLGTHVLTLGMRESKVLQQLGTDLEVTRLPAAAGPVAPDTPPESTWTVEKKIESGSVPVGTLRFDNHKLTSAVRYWDIKDSSGKSLYYAVSEAIASLVKEGHTKCRISNYSKAQMADDSSGNGSGTRNSSGVLIDCGPKSVAISLTLSDVSGAVPTQVAVIEQLRK